VHCETAPPGAAGETRRREWWRRRNVEAVGAALAGGEDYELLFAIPKRGGGRLRNVTRQVADPALTKIGTFTKDAALIVDRNGREEELPRGYEHFKDRGRNTE
jgi:thiamine monophosphate kinase